MDQSYEMGEGRLSIKGRRDGQLIRMGDEIKVRVVDADIKRRRIEMEFVELLSGATESKGGEGKSRSRSGDQRENQNGQAAGRSSSRGRKGAASRRKSRKK
jgi:hypothetical protein